MAILIGMDEAGYGPNLGPLVVGATAWSVDEWSEDRGRGSGEDYGDVVSNASTAVLTKSRKKPATNEIDLYRLLRPVVSRTPSERRLAIADSKVLYKPGHGLRQLERGVLGAVAATGQSLANWSTLVEHFSADPDRHEECVPWHDGFECRLPVDATNDELTEIGKCLLRTGDCAGVRLIALRARLVYPAQFNDLVADFGTKGAALSHLTVGLLREVMDAVAPEHANPDHLLPTPSPQPPAPSPQPAITIVCDKHGGRNYYASLLQHHFSEHWIEPLHEGGAESVYEWGPAEARVRVSFRVGGEAFLPTALASMTAKYLRELAMRAFNEFWCARVPNLRPTAGYPLDARRFRNAIAAVQRELGMDDHVLWRCR